MTIYANFFQPQTISILFCLHESAKEGEQTDPRGSVAQFLVSQVLQLSDAQKNCLSGHQFEKRLVIGCESEQFIEKYKLAVGQITNFNDFYREVSNMLKTLRSIRNNKLEQGNLVDFLVRRMYIYFEKLDFSQIVSIYENFKLYLMGEGKTPKQHQFMLTKSIEQAKFTLQNYSSAVDLDVLQERVDKLSECDHTSKTSYLKGLLKAQEGVPVESTHEMHRYFDRCLGNLFAEKGEAGGNKINHCILSGAWGALQLGQLQQALQAISEGLRISQNNTDQESINNCIIYLYKIAEQLGRHQEQILLAEHAITHSINLANPLLMVFSCLSCSGFERRHDCLDPTVLLLRSRAIHWTDALHFAKKKIHSQFQSNCKNIYHSYRSLLIPSFIAKIAVLLHLPQLAQLLLNPYFQRPQLSSLDVYREFRQDSEIDKRIEQARLRLNLGQQKLLLKSLSDLEKMETLATSPLLIIKIRSFFCQVLAQQGPEMKALKGWQSLAEICRTHGFVKEELVKLQNSINRLLIRNGLLLDSLVRLQQTLRDCQAHHMQGEQVVCLLLKAQAYLQLGRTEESLEIIRGLQEGGKVSCLALNEKILFQKTKMLLNRQIANILCSSSGSSNLIQILQISRNVQGQINQFVQSKSLNCRCNQVIYAAFGLGYSRQQDLGGFTLVQFRLVIKKNSRTDLTLQKKLQSPSVRLTTRLQKMDYY